MTTTSPIAEAALWIEGNDPDPSSMREWQAHAEATIAALGLDVLTASSILRLDELAFAFFLSRGHPAAMARFEAELIPEIDMVYRRFGNLPLSHDEVRQRVRAKLLTGEPPAIVSFRATGPLRAWVRSVAARLLLNVAAREQRELPHDEDFLDALVDSEPEAERAYIRHACRAEFRAALRSAIATLDPRERAVLKYSLADGLSIDAIARIYRVHRATAARWLQHGKRAVAQEAHRQIASDLAVSDEEAESIVRAALSGIGSSWLRDL